MVGEKESGARVLRAWSPVASGTYPADNKLTERFRGRESVGPSSFRGDEQAARLTDRKTVCRQQPLGGSSRREALAWTPPAPPQNRHSILSHMAGGGHFCPGRDNTLGAVFDTPEKVA